jgi:acyl carrier protein
MRDGCASAGDLLRAEIKLTVETTVREFLRNDLGKDVAGIGADDSLLESGALDSVAVMRLVAFLESTYGIAVTDDDLMPENFDTFAAIVEFIERRQAGTRD